MTAYPQGRPQTSSKQDWCKNMCSGRRPAGSSSCSRFSFCRVFFGVRARPWIVKYSEIYFQRTTTTVNCCDTASHTCPSSEVAVTLVALRIKIVSFTKVFSMFWKIYKFRDGVFPKNTDTAIQAKYSTRKHALASWRRILIARGVLTKPRHCSLLRFWLRVGQLHNVVWA